MKPASEPTSIEMIRRRIARPHVWLAALSLGLALAPPSLLGAPPAAGVEQRRTAIVKAVEKVRASVVNIRGQKTVSEDASAGRVDASRRVNGMGTGVVVDSHGYIVTNYHVVDGVTKIQVTLADGTAYVARLISRDPATDLAIIKIDAERLPLVEVGTSSDLMIGETVIAVGNAYGYEHTVTRGIISALHRPVQVSESQNYADLIQTDASINPGNSGGPLLNIDGQVIGINVAVRVGAQGIGFAMPIDKVMQVAAELLSVKRIDHRWHGVVAGAVVENGLLVDRVEADSPAAQGGLQPGDVIMSVGAIRIERLLDLERALLGKKEGEQVEMSVHRAKAPVKVSFALTSFPKQLNSVADRAWDLLGLRLAPVPTDEFEKLHSRYRGGLRITDVRTGSPAARQGIRSGDVLVGMHVWETISVENVAYVLGRGDEDKQDLLKFFILRDGQTLYGHIALNSENTRQASRK